MASSRSVPLECDEAAHLGSAPTSSVPGERKRKASVDYDEHDQRDGSPKRSRLSEENHYRRRRDSSPSRIRRASGEDARLSYDDPVTRKPATTEEKKRGKRLFGGLLSTLSQTNANSQQRRREEIQKRQQERLQQRKAEDDQLRMEKAARLTKIRMAEQINFEERVMQNKHAKIQWAARHLKTKAQPPIYYHPWKLTAAQEDLIDDQISEAKNVIEREREAFRVRERKHEERYGTRRLTPPPRGQSLDEADDAKETNKAAPDTGAIPEDSNAKSAVKMEQRLDDEEDSHEVVMETNEDTVIY